MLDIDPIPRMNKSVQSSILIHLSLSFFLLRLSQFLLSPLPYRLFSLLCQPFTMKRIIRSFSRPNSVVEPLQSIDSRARRNLGKILSNTRPAPAPEVFVLQFPHRTVEQLKQQSTPLPPPPSNIPVQSKQPLPQQQQQERQQTNQKRQRRLHHHQQQQQKTMEFIESNNMSNVSVPPRARLLELKTNAEFAAEDFNHTIKTWVNMGSLLVKQVHFLFVSLMRCLLICL